MIGKRIVVSSLEVEDNGFQRTASVGMQTLYGGAYASEVAFSDLPDDFQQELKAWVMRGLLGEGEV
jgi:hypothetical protein